MRRHLWGMQGAERVPPASGNGTGTRDTGCPLAGSDGAGSNTQSGGQASRGQRGLARSCWESSRAAGGGGGRRARPRPAGPGLPAPPGGRRRLPGRRSRCAPSLRLFK